MIENTLVTKIIHLLRDMSSNKNEMDLIEVIDFSEFEFVPHWNKSYPGNLYNLKVHVHPSIFTKHIDQKGKFETSFGYRIRSIIDEDLFELAEVTLLPNIEKLEVSSFKISAIMTKWEEIDSQQAKLIEKLKQSSDSLDFQGIGNISRTILQNLANYVFDETVHIPADTARDLSKGKFKNQLTAYIEYNLSGRKNKKLRKFATSAIALVGDSIDLMNKTTHDLSAEKQFAEMCVHSTLSTIQIIKTIDNLS